jgi:hypothetical protein
MMADDAWNRCLAARRNIPHVEGEKAFCYPMEVDGVVQQGCGFDADWNRYSAALHDACAADQ